MASFAWNMSKAKGAILKSVSCHKHVLILHSVKKGEETKAFYMFICREQ